MVGVYRLTQAVLRVGAVLFTVVGKREKPGTFDPAFCKEGDTPIPVETVVYACLHVIVHVLFYCVMSHCAVSEAYQDPVTLLGSQPCAQFLFAPGKPESEHGFSRTRGRLELDKRNTVVADRIMGFLRIHSGEGETLICFRAEACRVGLVNGEGAHNTRTGRVAVPVGQPECYHRGMLAVRDQTRLLGYELDLNRRAGVVYGPREALRLTTVAALDDDFEEVITLLKIDPRPSTQRHCAGLVLRGLIEVDLTHGPPVQKKLKPVPRTVLDCDFETGNRRAETGRRPEPLKARLDGIKPCGVVLRHRVW